MRLRRQGIHLVAAADFRNNLVPARVKDAHLLYPGKPLGTREAADLLESQSGPCISRDHGTLSFMSVGMRAAADCSRRPNPAYQRLQALPERKELSVFDAISAEGEL
jgi:hypothetical protein